MRYCQKDLLAIYEAERGLFARETVHRHGGLREVQVMDHGSESTRVPAHMGEEAFTDPSNTDMILYPSTARVSHWYQPQ